MKITDVTATRYRAGRDPNAYAGDIHLVEVHTDAGVSGTGFVTATRATSQVAATLVRQPLKAAIMGEDGSLSMLDPWFGRPRGFNRPMRIEDWVAHSGGNPVQHPPHPFGPEGILRTPPPPGLFPE